MQTEMKETAGDPAVDEHLRAREIDRHRIEVEEIRRRARHWRLTDCAEDTLEEMRHALISEIEELEEALAAADRRFLLYVENARPLDTEQALRTINRLTAEWEGLNAHLQEIDEALLERHLTTRLSRFLGGMERVYALNMAVFLSIIIVVALTLIEFIFPLPGRVNRWIITVDTAICLFLIADFFLRLFLSEDRSWYLRRYWIDLVASIPFTQFLRFGRLLRIGRLIRLLRLGRAMRMLFFSFRSLGKLAQTFQINLLKRSVLIAITLLFFGALTIRALEGPREVTLLAFDESLWWSFTTVVTGGFADLYNPGTVVGRLLTVGLVLLGLTVTGIFTASLTSVLVVDDSTRIQQNQQDIEERLRDLGQRLDLLSEETNEGLIALETVSQALSNQTSATGVARHLADAIVRDFQGLQASVHLLGADELSLRRVAHAGDDTVAPPQRLHLGEAFPGRIVAQLLQQQQVAESDLEPETELVVSVQGLAMVCPLVAGRRVLGVLHVVLPDTLARYYLYNRVPMTLAHHAAMAFYAAELAEQA